MEPHSGRNPGIVPDIPGLRFVPSGLRWTVVRVHRVDQHGDIFRIDVGRDAMAEIEHVAGMRAEVVEHAAHFAADNFG